MALRTPEAALAPGEAEALAQAIATVSEHYDVTGVIPPETAAWLNLAQVAGLIYGPRLFAVRARKAAERAAANTQEFTANGHTFSTGAQGHAAH